MTETVFRFRVTKRHPSADLEDAGHSQAAAANTTSWADYDAPCQREDSIFVAMKSVDDLRAHDAWAAIFAGEGSPAIFLKPVQATSESMLLGGDTTIGALSDYFGPWLNDPDVRFEIEPLEAVGNGAGPGGVPWETIYTAFENIRFALEFYGAVEVGRRAVQYVQGRRAGPARHEVHVWTHFNRMPRRLLRYIRRRDEWRTARLQRLLGLELLQLGKLLRECGFETTPDHPDRWTKTPYGPP